MEVMCVHSCVAAQRAEPATGIVEEHRDHFSDEVILESKLARWIGGASCTRRDQDEERRAFLA